MKYFVPIELKSIKRNKDAGSEITFVPQEMVMEFECSELPSYLVDGENCHISERSGSFNRGIVITSQKGTIVDREIINKIYLEKPKDFKFEISQDSVEINHPPIPEYSFKYVNIKVKCDNCESEVNNDDLCSDIFYDGYEEYFSSNICPVCEEADCCELEYETIEEALKRKNK